MNWLNLRLTTLRTPEYVGAEPTHRATWLNVLAYCCEQENGGRIVGARSWKCRQWQQTCGVTRDEVDGAGVLLSWDGADLIVWEYPSDKEAEVRGKREVAKVNGSRGGRRPLQSKEPTSEPTSVTEVNQRRQAEGEREGEGNKKPAGGEPAAQKVRKEADGPNAEFIRRWMDEFPKHHNGEKYLFQGGKDGAAVARLLKACGKTPEELERVFVAAWKHSDLFNCKAAASIARFVGSYNEIRAELNALKPTAPPQNYIQTEWPAWLAANGHPAVEYQFAPSFLRDDFQKARKATKAA